MWASSYHLMLRDSKVMRTREFPCCASLSNYSKLRNLESAVDGVKMQIGLLPLVAS